MKRLISLIFFIPFFSFSQHTSDIGYENNDFIENIIFTPLFTSHFASNSSKNTSHSFMAYGSDFYFKFFKNLKISSRILNIEGDHNIALKNYIDSMAVFPGMNKIDESISYFSLNVDYKFH